MKINFNKDFYLNIFFLFLVVLMVAAYNEFARYGLPDAKGMGHKDDQSIAFFIASILFLLLTFNKYIARPIIVFFLFLITFFAICNWWYFDFYRDYITPGSIKLAIYAEESSMAWAGLKYKQEALYFSLMMLFFTVLIFSLEKYKPKNKILLLVSLVFFIFAVQQQLVISDMAKGGLKHRGVNHISYFIKGFSPRKKFEITSTHLKQIQQALPQKHIGSFSSKYPLYQAVDKTTVGSIDRKNVIIVVMESVRMAETGLYENPRSSSTPNLDMFARESINFSANYANSNQTVRGEVAILCSALDYMNGGTYSMSGEQLKTNCLPSILSQYGYETYWIHGYKKSFFNRENFFPKIGFQHLLDRDVINANQDMREIGWGLSDEEVFEYAINRLEQTDQPFFAEIMTLSNHYPYLWDWGIEFPERLKFTRELQEGKDNLYPGYKRGIYYTDYALGKFLQRFKKSKLYENTLLIITSDHGIWTFPDEVLNSTGVKTEFQKNEMYFRLPLLIHAKNLKPAKIESPVSQVDIAPTVLDYLGIKYPNAFLGDSLLDRSAEGLYPIYFMASGSYGVRRNDLYCYPVDDTDLCDADDKESFGKKSFYRVCNSGNKSNSRPVCVSTSDDLLVTTDHLLTKRVDNTNDDTFIDLSQQFLDYGFMPSEDIL